jgi:hypothetical protein
MHHIIILHRSCVALYYILDVLHDTKVCGGHALHTFGAHNMHLVHRMYIIAQGMRRMSLLHTHCIAHVHQCTGACDSMHMLRRIRIIRTFSEMLLPPST